ncbi:conserved protein of unknown function (plasmid) [Rhodovastum atsumiense]|uniref:Uncharacterized protein n=1 Tax=Rhodovastum atsumiense TaxID=504468 RepID=A0A5M6IU36_9PROT|nr:hypothetical protein [Rhodovastum atsumiense]KAA5611782.1 hypothetical protein F1189_12130 [Rhodovastum atsumiense]CAH2606117.1 conserved protein of unknown function [Rhodovastum atsumiense]
MGENGTVRSRPPAGSWHAEAYRLHVEEGLSFAEIGRRFSVAAESVRYAVRTMERNGGARPPGAQDASWHMEAWRLYADGMSVRDIAARFEVDRSTVNLALRKLSGHLGPLRPRRKPTVRYDHAAAFRAMVEGGLSFAEAAARFRADVGAFRAAMRRHAAAHGLEMPTHPPKAEDAAPPRVKTQNSGEAPKLTRATKPTKAAATKPDRVPTAAPKPKAVMPPLPAPPPAISKPPVHVAPPAPPTVARRPRPDRSGDEAAIAAFLASRGATRIEARWAAGSRPIALPGA